MNLESFGLCFGCCCCFVPFQADFYAATFALLTLELPSSSFACSSLVGASFSLVDYWTNMRQIELCTVCAVCRCVMLLLRSDRIDSVITLVIWRGHSLASCTRLWCTQLCLGFTCSKWIEKQWLLLFTRQCLLVIIAAALIATGGAQFRSVLFCVVCFVSAITCWLEMSPTTTTTPIDWLFNYQCPSLLFLSCTSFPFCSHRLT